MTDRTRDRVMGGVFLTALAIIVLPMLFDGAGVESPAPPSLPQTPASDTGPVPAMDPANLANAEALRKRIDNEGFDQSTSTKVGDPVVAPADRRLSTTLPPACGVFNSAVLPIARKRSPCAISCARTGISRCLPK